ncbi:tetratricopeptide repeat-containing protein [Treponema vincentii]|uniref:tetratricopeptide repeat protein n=1 Tax=Treponema vincentii TaxID=69710 RepID=UPI0020A30ADB|nr:tetratricopeptide repeat protein [Treponema vincentii]UTC59087.1 tetratricopeptide repeat-containing protein [Treponema vincentii]
MPPVIRFKKYLFIFFAFCAGILHCSCSHDRLSYLYTGLHEHKNEQKDLVALFEKEDEPQIRFALIDKIAAHLQAEHKIKSLAVFLQSVIDAEPNNPYNGYFLLRLAAAYRDVQEDAIAAYYFEYIVQNYSDMIVNGQSIHLLCLKNLIELSGTGTKSVVYYSRLLTDFYNEFDPAQAYFMLAQAYEKQGEWQLAIQAYTQFLNLHRFDVIIPGIPDSYGYARKIVDYSTSTKSWTFNTLDDLVKTIKAAIRARDYATLERCRSKVNFFAMSWKQELSDTQQQPDTNLRDFMYGSAISIASELDPSSTPYEAYLRTSGWNQYIRTWYLYFKKINFPADPTIHGRWEWAGIYYGEKI